MNTSSSDCSAHVTYNSSIDWLWDGTNATSPAYDLSWDAMEARPSRLGKSFEFQTWSSRPGQGLRHQTTNTEATISFWSVHHLDSACVVLWVKRCSFFTMSLAGCMAICQYVCYCFNRNRRLPLVTCWLTFENAMVNWASQDGVYCQDVCYALCDADGHFGVLASPRCSCTEKRSCGFGPTQNQSLDVQG